MNQCTTNAAYIHLICGGNWANKIPSIPTPLPGQGLAAHGVCAAAMGMYCGQQCAGKCNNLKTSCSPSNSSSSKSGANPNIKPGQPQVSSGSNTSNPKLPQWLNDL